MELTTGRRLWGIGRYLNYAIVEGTLRQSVNDGMNGIEDKGCGDIDALGA